MFNSLKDKIHQLPISSAPVTGHHWLCNYLIPFSVFPWFRTGKSGLFCQHLTSKRWTGFTWKQFILLCFGHTSVSQGLCEWVIFLLLKLFLIYFRAKKTPVTPPCWDSLGSKTPFVDTQASGPYAPWGAGVPKLKSSVLVEPFDLFQFLLSMGGNRRGWPPWLPWESQLIMLLDPTDWQWMELLGTCQSVAMTTEALVWNS